MRRGLTFRDPAFLGGLEDDQFPDPANPDMWLWMDADYHVATIYGATTWGDHSDKTADKTVNSGRNLWAQNIGEPIVCSTNGNYENILNKSSDVDGWALGVGMTRDDATHVTFPAGGAAMQQLLDYRYFLPNTNYRFEVKLRNVSGNTNLRLRMTGTSGDIADIVIDGTLQTYTLNFNTGAGTTPYVNIQDLNAGGNGQLEVREPHVYRVGLDGTYAETTGLPRPVGVNGHRILFTGHATNRNFQHTSIGAGNGISDPCTFYWTMWMNPWTSPGRIFSLTAGTIYNLFVSMETDGSAGKIRAYTVASGGAGFYTTNAYANRTWYACCLTMTADGTVAVLRVNDDETIGALKPIDANGYLWRLGEDVADGHNGPIGITDFLGFHSAHTIDLRNAYINYLKAKVGIA